MKTPLFLFFSILSFIACGQGLINNGSKILIPSGSSVFINSGSFTNNTVAASDGSITLGGEITLDGNWTNDADNKLSLSAGTVTFDGSSTQNITGTSYTDFYNLTIASGANVDVPVNHFLTVNNNLTMTGTLTIKSDYSGEARFGSLIDAGSNSGNLNVEIYLSGGDKNHLVSSPVYNAPLSSIFDTSNGNYNVYWYNEDQSAKTIDNRWEKQSTALVQGRGYTAAYTNNTSRTFTGTLNTSSDITINVTKAGSSSANGWNLLGNPYPSSISCSSFVSDNSAINGTLYFWDENGTYATNDYASWNGVGSTTSSAGGNAPGDYIPPGQAFFVESSYAGSTFTNTATVYFKNTQRTHKTSADYYFFEPKPRNFPRIKLGLLSPDSAYNEVLIGFPEDATDNFDRLYDGRKLEGNPDLSFYSFLDGEKYTIQGLSPFLNDEAKSVLLGFKISKSGSYLLSVPLFENLVGVPVTLEDKMLKRFIVLKDSETYPFNSDTGTINNRFVLHFNYSSSINESYSLEQSKIYQSHPNQIIIQSPFNGEAGVQICDVNGKILKQLKHTKISWLPIDYPFESGIYLVRIFSEQTTFTKKIFIK